MAKNILTLHTGFFDDADVVIQATDAPILDLRKDLNEKDWDDVLNKIMDADLIVTA